jgi:hypothetical protein
MDEFWEYGHDLEILNYDWVKRIEAGQDIAKMLAGLHHSAKFHNRRNADGQKASHRSVERLQRVLSVLKGDARVS